MDALGGFLDGLQKSHRRGGRHEVDLVHDDHLASALDRRGAGHLHNFDCLLREDRRTDTAHLVHVGVHSPHDQVVGAVGGIVRAGEENRGEGAGGGLLAAPLGPEQEIGVERAGGGASQQVDCRCLAGDSRPHRC